MENIIDIALFLSSKPEARDIVEGLEENLVQVKYIVKSGCLNEAAEDMDLSLIGVGVAQLRNSDDLEAFVNTSQSLTKKMPWIGLIEPSVIEHGDARGLVTRNFFAFHEAPYNLYDVACLIRHAKKMADIEYVETAAECSDTLAGDEYEMVGTTACMRKMFDTIRRVSAVDAPVFICGESGTGKELAAHAIHERSRRAAGPFVAVNCGALPANLVQSELFGYEKGAFTGANQRTLGRIESANGGTLFLDEIGDLPLDLQVNLLRFLEDHRIQRVGGREDIEVDVRVLAATHVNLEKAVEEGRFREDLYHRLNVLQINIPALREREDDIEVLAKFFFDKFSDEKSAQLKGFSLEALTIMRQYHWPGNIRELINRVRRAMVMCDKRLIKASDLGLDRRTSCRQRMTLEQARDAAEYNVLISALMRNKKKVKNAADELGISRVTLYRLLEKHGLGKHEKSEDVVS
ncbi:DNA-binding transcriptional response regulator, NtrC family, contains REC, AAA-type ATPase, and a Fis-type DNA-binding domains [Franzmannia pantelleriensis]|uniref:DNA-binding transcriptional response regulator, NtrC family, contains REC, AAA-type ATPase, and a Fis-type DNA-binding domains n=2 Tax=Franzmannia pantelleriensis TaxID=48727 RepID=A0A1G9EK13_9GAMM|nr:DNA-binding transcriptional response regulator, NtrC family, contains REC, AAA-type ATPase, and a Fis-type DNA-binding domains [Halomonas pantelleriensis]